MKKVLMIVNYFYPEYASTGQLMTELCKELQDDFQITVIAAIPSYSGSEYIKSKKRIQYDKLENINIVRVRVSNLDKNSKVSRIKYILSYFINALIAITKLEKHDIVFAISQPPILGGLLGYIGKKLKKGKFIYCIEDFNPEQAEAIKYAKSSLIFNIARKIDNFSCTHSDKIIVVGRDMKQTMIKRNAKIDVNKIEVINNWINENEVYPLDKSHEQVNQFLVNSNLVDKFIIMYSGNIGLYYDLENLIKVFGKFKDYNDLHFVFIGEGAKKEELERYVNENGINNITFLPYQPKDKIVYSLNAADVHLVTNQKGIKGVSVPSKIYGVMAVGKPVLGILEKGSEAEMLVTNSGCGFTVEPQKYKEIEEKIKFIYENRNMLKEMGLKGRKYLEENLAMQKSINSYRDVLHNI